MSDHLHRARQRAKEAQAANTNGVPAQTKHSASSPVSPPIAPYRPFPLDVLPEPVRGFVRAAAAAINCDPAFVVMPTLAALASAIGNTRRIQLKHGWEEPPILWSVIVAESGAKKSPPLDLALRPVYDRQHGAMKRFAQEMSDHRKALKEHKRRQTKWEKSREEGGDPPEEPSAPICDRCWCDDATVESVAPLLVQQPRGLVMKRDELAAWFGSFDKYAKGSGRSGGDAAKWIEMHGGRSVLIDRKTTANLYIPRAALCVTGGIQPAILKRSLTQELHDNGLLARLLLAMPPVRVRQWSEARVDSALLARHHDIYDRLFSLEPGRAEDGDWSPIALPLTPDAKECWIAFYNAHAAEQADLTGDLAAAWSKLEGYAARLALVEQCVRWAAEGCLPVGGPDAVDVKAIEAGVTLSRWFGAEATRIYDMLGESDEQAERRQLEELVQRRGGRITARELMRCCRSYKTADGAEAALEELVKTGRAAWEPAPGSGQGGRPTRCLCLTRPVDVDRTAAEQGKNGVVSTSAVSTNHDEQVFEGEV